MKILLATTDFLPKIGGVSIMLHHLACALFEAGHEVLVVPPPPSAPGFDQPYAISDGSGRPWPVGPWYTRRWTQHRIDEAMVGTARDFRADALLLGDQLYAGKLAKSSIKARQQLPIALATYAYGKEVGARLYGGDATLQQRMAGFIGPVFGVGMRKDVAGPLVDASDVIFAISSATAALVREWRGREAVVTGCGVAPADYERELHMTPGFDRHAKVRWRRELGLPSAPVVSFVGRLIERKNVALILRAIAQIGDAHVVIVGEGPEGRKLRRLARRLGIGARVHWMGQQSEERKWQVLRASDVLCLPSVVGPYGDIEGFGIVLLEAAAAGTPVIAAATGGMPDVVAHEHTGLLCSGNDAAEVAVQLQRLLEDDALARRCVANARRQIEEHYNWDRVAAIVADTLARAVA